MDGRSRVLDLHATNSKNIVILRTFRRNGRIWITRKCRCGKKFTSRLDSFRQGDSQTCGCLRVETGRKNGLAARRHGMSQTRTYTSWECMVQRCTNPKNPNFRKYGKRGITICKRWRRFECFLADMGRRPLGKTLERKNNNRGYKPSNCRWATRKEQRANQCPKSEW